MSEEARGDDVYQPQDDDGQDPPNDELDMENALGERDLDDTMEEGYSPPERPLAVDEYGTTGAEERQGESLDRRLAREVDDVEPPDGDGIGDLAGGEGEPLERTGREERAGRLGAAEDPTARRSGVFAEDVGIDGGAASAEEAAVHVTDEADGRGRRD
ncbi:MULTISPECIES: DUF5709 domain-containing protein [Streptomyces]|uniref:DUF5709 domain-containing protein n=1 Tax=Streptomyces TaxID=1883 RepID=UPI0004C4A323|nr:MULTISPECIES: DUF5709 domain-containing protein [Streptomyces]RPK81027.1 hypothetical protein EES46_29960 [Streptomyces sp. ADI98-10]